MKCDKSVNNEPDLIYTELQPCSPQCSQNTYIQNIQNNFDTEVTSNSSQDIVRQFLGSQSDHMANPFNYTLSTNMANQDPDPTNLVLQSIEDQCNGLPKDTFVTRLVQFCDNDAIALEQLRLQYFVIAKQRPDFPFASANLKKNACSQKQRKVSHCSHSSEADKSVSVVPLDSPIRSETPRVSTACPILPAHDRIHVSQETIPKTDNYQVSNMSTLPKIIVESTNIQANDTNSISVHFPRSVCNPKTSDFKGFTRKSKRVSRFYIGGIDKSCSSEDAMRYFLSERNIRVTFLRYFNRPSKRTAAAQLNIVADDEYLITHPEFWPQGIYMKPWLPWEQFASEHSINPS
ncbi:unnamed protein product [Mytilus coruscus]|uniref:RRM domain-containing protein n=1 Tax=Mytilus coruscus TaxID=42192 RepID=A0A6J8CG33_MYTCO|nr:unnamed protein product [Mytilus coruscus]